MKQLLYITIAILLSACSNDNAIDSPTDSDKTYPVSFNITEASFNIDESNLRTTGDSTKLQMFIYFYKADGKIYNYEEKIYDLNTTGSYAYTKDLLPGKYYVAFLTIKSVNKSDYTPLYYPIGFSADYYPGSSKNIYYATTEITVVANNTTTQTESIDIKPMWSQLNVKIGDAQTFDTPEGTQALVFNVTPNLYGFGFENKLASKSNQIHYSNWVDPSIVKIDGIRKNATFTYTTSVSKTNADNTLGVNIQYVKLNNDTISEVLQTRTLKIANTTVDNGFIYSVKGNLGSTNSSNGFNISLGEFNKEDVIINF